MNDCQEMLSSALLQCQGTEGFLTGSVKARPHPGQRQIHRPQIDTTALHEAFSTCLLAPVIAFIGDPDDLGGPCRRRQYRRRTVHSRVGRHYSLAREILP